MATSYLSQLQQTGRVHAAMGGTDAAAAVAELPAALEAADRAARLELPGNPPPLSMPAAVWAGTIFYHACRFLVYRDIGGDIVAATLAVPCPQRPSASAAYSVDLVFRYLPDLIALARGIAEDDPLVAGLMRLARDWPLSSVGVAIPASVDVSALMADRCLRTLYVDRILAKKDSSRTGNPAVALAIKEAVGIHSELGVL